MKLKPEMKALCCAVIAACISLGGALAIAHPIRIFSNGEAARSGSSTPGPVLEIASSPAVVSQGHEFFEMSCSECHADDATGDEGPNLRNLAISNARIAATIRKGVKGEMPTFGKKYNDQQIAALIAFLRSLR